MKLLGDWQGFAEDLSNDTSRKVVGAVCDGLAGLVTARLNDGTLVFAGKRVAGPTNSEKEAVGLTEEVSFFLETRL